MMYFDKDDKSTLIGLVVILVLHIIVMSLSALYICEIFWFVCIGGIIVWILWVLLWLLLLWWFRR